MGETIHSEGKNPVLFYFLIAKSVCKHSLSPGPGILIHLTSDLQYVFHTRTYARCTFMPLHPISKFTCTWFRNKLRVHVHV